MKKLRKRYRIHGVARDNGIMCVWIGKLISGDSNDSEAIFSIRNIYGETKEVFKSDCEFS